MAEESVLQRKIQLHRPVVREDATRGWRTAFGRAARDLIGLDLSFSAASDTRRSLAEVLETMPERGLLMVVEGPKHDIGLVALSGDLASAILERQTIGRVSKATALPRRMTRTDAAMSSRLVDLALVHLSQAQQQVDSEWGCDYQYSSFLDEPRALGLLLDDIPYRVIDLTAHIAGTERVAGLQLVLPCPPAKPKIEPALPKKHDPAAFQEALRENVLSAPVTMRAVIARFSISLAELRALEEGSRLSLRGGTLDNISLIAPGNVVIAKGKLGQTNGMKAIRILSTADGKAQTEMEDLPTPSAAEPSPEVPEQEEAPPLANIA